MSRGFLLIDGPNLGFAGTSLKKLSVGEFEVQGIYHFLRFIRMHAARYPVLTPIILWDGMSWRKFKFKGYKVGREKDAPASKQDLIIQAQRDSYKAQQPLMAEALGLLGVRQMQADNLEADDLAGLLVKRYAAQGRTIMMISGDRDWSTLVRPKVGWYDPIREKLRTFAKFESQAGYRKTVKVKADDGTVTEQPGEWIGYPSPRAYLECKALMGDASDEVPGVGGIGEAGALELVRTYGSVADFLNSTIDGTMPKLPKKFADFALSTEKQGIWRRNMMLMDLEHPQIPKPVNLELRPGALDLEAFRLFCQRWVFQSITNNFDKWVEPFVGTVMEKAA